MRPYTTSALFTLLLLLVAGGEAEAQTAGASSGGAGSGGVNAAEHLDAPYLVLLSLDGFRFDYLDDIPTPAFQRLIAEGARADRMIPVFPTKTFPTHYTVATGMYAENHRLVGNRFWAPEKGGFYSMSNREIVEDGSWYGGEPIWVTAERQGMVSAAYHFVGTEADVGGVSPTKWYPFDASVSNREKVEKVLEWLALPADRRPHVLTLYFEDLDGAGHNYGPGTPQVRDAVERVDRELGRLLDGIDALPHGDQVYVIVVSDHGMIRIDPDRAQHLDMDAFPGVRLVTSGTYASLRVEEGGTARAPRVRDSLRAMLPEADVWLREEVPERFHYTADPRIGDIVVLAAPGSLVIPKGRSIPPEPYTHGWDNQALGMGAIFLARGPGISAGVRIEPFESVHVYPLMAHLLGLRPNPQADGRLEVLAPILEPPS
jgi:predicted AlkP superfamily pyrophosphatase or phosphodiesterase